VLVSHQQQLELLDKDDRIRPAKPDRVAMVRRALSEYMRRIRMRISAGSAAARPPEK